MINTKQLFNIKGLAITWLILGLVYLFLDFAYIGMARFEFNWGLMYAISFIGIALLLAATKPNILSGLCIAVIGVVVVFCQMQQMPIGTGVTVAALAFVGLLLAEFGVLHFKADAGIRYMTMVPFFLMAAWAFLYIYQRAANPSAGTPLTIDTLLNHGGVLVQSLGSILLIAGTYRKMTIVWIGLGAAAIGAMWLVIISGWGLTL